MKNTIRIKFNVSEITSYGNGGGVKVVLMPTITNSEENKSFLGKMPSGRIEIDLPELNGEFEFGEYYVDFIKAE